MRARLWTEQTHRVLPTSDGPIAVYPGDVVVVAVVRDARRAAELIAQLADEPERAER